MLDFARDYIINITYSISDPKRPKWESMMAVPGKMFLMFLRLTKYEILFLQEDKFIFPVLRKNIVH